jgi:cephalosporin-C deacetylase-like acetyl esterase
MCCRLVLLIAAVISVAADRPAIRPTVFEPGDARAAQFPKTMMADANRRMALACERESAAFAAVKTKEQWEKHRDERLAKLKASLGSWPAPPKGMRIETTRVVKGDGLAIHNILYESRPGMWVSANLYLPAEPPTEKKPGMLIVTAHHTAKTQGELQDMGMTWARAGCAVLVPDQLGYGERREHAFRTEKDLDKPYRAGRQDYYFRYNSNLQLSAVGESLMGWFVWDLMRGVDVLLKQPNVHKDQIVLLGSVAGGGDPAGVTAALDSRIAAVVPFNFGGWQPESQITKNPDRDFDWFGDGYWESTRGLRFGARDGFAHYVITGSVAPRKLLHAHEFAWDPKTDPAWPRLQKIFGFYDAKDTLRFAHGAGTVRSSGPGNTHCTHIGAEHRKMIHPAFKEWFGLPIPQEYSKRVPSDDLMCWTEEARNRLQPKRLHELAGGLAEPLIEGPPASLNALRKQWSGLLGNIEPAKEQKLRHEKSERIDGGSVTHFLLEVESGIALPGILMRPDRRGETPVVIMIAQHGKAGFLKDRMDAIDALFTAGVAVCMVDVRGTGELKPGLGADRGSARTSVSQTNLILGQPVIGSQLKDLRTVLRWLRAREGINGERLAVWGDSFAKVNPPDVRLALPLDVEGPAISEPAGDHLALLAALFEPKLAAVYSRGGASRFTSMFNGPYFAVPHDAIVPAQKQIPDAIVPSLEAQMKDAFRREGTVDAGNREAQKAEEPTATANWLAARLFKK